MKKENETDAKAELNVNVMTPYFILNKSYSANLLANCIFQTSIVDCLTLFLNIMLWHGPQNYNPALKEICRLALCVRAPRHKLKRRPDPTPLPADIFVLLEWTVWNISKSTGLWEKTGRSACLSATPHTQCIMKIPYP